MNWYEIVLGVVLIVVSVLIVVFTLAQEQKGQGLSGAIMGESSATMAAGRERGVDAKLAKLTKICGVVFFVVTLVVCVLSACDFGRVTKMKRVRQALWLCKQRPGGPFFVDVYKGRAPSDDGAT